MLIAADCGMRMAFDCLPHQVGVRTLRPSECMLMAADCLPHQVEDDGVHVRCTKCGELGHNRSSRLCPLWGVGDPEETKDEAFRDGTVKQDHGFGKLKLKIDSTKLVTKPP